LPPDFQREVVLPPDFQREVLHDFRWPGDLHEHELEALVNTPEQQQQQQQQNHAGSREFGE
jgi:hypothetical protein